MTIPELDLIPEGIANDSSAGIFYISSIYKNKIIQVTENGHTDFIKSNKDGFMGGVGLKVDYRRKILWACSGDAEQGKFTTGIFAYDLLTKQLLRKYLVNDTAAVLFNDIAIDEVTGTIYITDAYGHALWMWKNGDEVPVKISVKGVLKYPNGIAWLKEKQLLFVATSDGLKTVSTDDYTATLLKMPLTANSSVGLDGIAWWRNSIIGVQNYHRNKAEHKLLQYVLNGDLSGIIEVRVIDTANQHFNIPTTFAIIRDSLFLIANSQMENLEEGKKINTQNLEPVKVLMYKLK
jgi:hypothetical protein